MATQEETAFQEALTAIEHDELDRARDILTRLIKANPNQAEYWMWMSAVVDSPKERSFCLNETLKRDPKNVTARRGLILLGELPPDPSLAVPAKLQQRNWAAGKTAQPVDSQVGLPAKKPGLPWRWIAGGAAALVLLVGGVALLSSLNRPAAEGPGFLAWIQRYTPAPYVPGSPTAVITTSGAAQHASVTPTLNLVTATPTALYVNTPHPRTESYRAGINAFTRGDLAGAINYLLQAGKEDPRADIYYLLGEAYRLQNKPKEAATAYDTAIQTDARFAPAYLGRARLRLQTSPENADPIRSDFEKAIALDANLLEAHIELAKFKLAKKEASAALISLEPAFRLAPASPLPYFVRAQIYLAQNQPEKALEDARQANKLDPGWLAGYRLLAEVKRASADLAGSIPALEIYTQYVTDDADALAWLGQAIAARGDFTTALRRLDQAVALNGQSFEARLQRGFVYIELADAQKAMDDLRQAYLLRQDAFGVSLGLGRIALLNRDSAEALRSLGAALRQAGSDMEKALALFWRAQALELGKQNALAAADWADLLKLPSSAMTSAMRETAQQRLQALATPTPPTPSATATLTLSPTITLTPSRTATSTPTLRPSPSATITPTSSPTPTSPVPSPSPSPAADRP